MNGRRVTAFLKEKKIDLQTYELNVREGEQFKEPFTTMNPFHCVPFLELEGGQVITESLSICRYLEEIYPNPPLFGGSPEERAHIDMWARRIELDALAPLGWAIRNKLPFFEGKVLSGTRNEIKQSGQVVQRGQQAFEVFLNRVEPLLRENSFICGANFTIADITGYFIFTAAEGLEIEIPDKFSRILGWREKISARECFIFD